MQKSYCILFLFLLLYISLIYNVTKNLYNILRKIRSSLLIGL